MWVEFVGPLICSKKLFPGYSSLRLRTVPTIVIAHTFCADWPRDGAY